MPRPDLQRKHPAARALPRLARATALAAVGIALAAVGIVLAAHGTAAPEARSGHLAYVASYEQAMLEARVRGVPIWFTRHKDG